MYLCISCVRVPCDVLVHAASQHIVSLCVSLQCTAQICPIACNQLAPFFIPALITFSLSVCTRRFRAVCRSCGRLGYNEFSVWYTHQWPVLGAATMLGG